MRSSQRSLILALAALALSATACWFHGPGEIRKGIAEATGTTYSQEIGLTLGRTSMAIARLGLRTANDEDIPRLKGIRKVQVGIYHPVSATPEALEQRPIAPAVLPGWAPIVRMHEDGENVLVMIRQRRDRIRGMLVIVDDGEELVVVRMYGRLDDVLQEAMKLGFDEADRPDLYAPALKNEETSLSRE